MNIWKAFFFFMMVLALSNTVISQSTYQTTRGEVSFNASTPLEDIVAVNTDVNAIMKIENGKFASVLLVSDFKFERKLMQEHFNENYMESTTYPKAYFSGIIIDVREEDLTDTPGNYKVEGKLTMHGVTKQWNAIARLSKKAGGVLLETSFIVAPEEFNIEVPKLLFKKIAQEVKVDIAFLMTEQ